MFSSDQKKTKLGMETSSQQNVIAQGTKIIGDVISSGPFRIDGSIEGNVKTTGKLLSVRQGQLKVLCMVRMQILKVASQGNLFCPGRYP